jgi:hypothetical protein
MHRRRVDLLIPVVKGWSTDLSINTTSMGLQVHGGMGYVEETGVAQHYRDARIASIYEGTTGIQAMDLVMRKIRRDDGWSVAELVADIRQSSSALEARNDTAADWQLLARAVNSAADLITQTTDWLLDATEPELALAAAGNVLEVFGVGLGMWCMGDAAFASSEENNAEAAARLRLAEFYTLQVFPEAAARSEALLYGSKAVLGLDVVA